MPTTALVAGATGYTGREVVRLLRARKVQVVAHVRPDSSRLDEWTRKFETLGAIVDSTPWESDAMAAMVAERAPDLVFGLLGTTQARARREAAQGVPKEANSYETVDYGMTKMLMSAMEAASSTGRFVYLSSEGARNAANPSKKPAGAYLDVRWRIESELEAGPLAWTVARPSFITGPDREESRAAESVGAVFGNAALSLLGALGAKTTRERYRSITATQLAAALVHHALAPSSVGKVLRGEDLRGFGPGQG
ncbi:MAG: NAD(P)H-binding protein [Deltaproteobacteria bacterium]|nr:NAD(P)H-binding protein [Deltaproteobacteria bacterium]